MLHPLIALVDRGVIEGRGLIALGLIQEGEVISTVPSDSTRTLLADVLSWSPEKQDEYLVHSYQLSETECISEHDDAKYMNHSCDPTSWWRDDETMIARRDIQPGEEITYDYATTELDVPMDMMCRCGSAMCRGHVTNKDYLLPEWQRRFGDHLPMHMLKAIARAKPGE
jgi:uncharacterized protein